MILALVAMLALPIPASGVAATHLRQCPGDDEYLVGAYCGSLRVPLDWHDAKSGAIHVAFEFVPADDAGSAATIVDVAGGPGASSIGDGFAVRTIFGPVLRDHNLLLMDERGTGSSTAIDCHGLQSPQAIVPGVGDFNAQVAACGRFLNHHFRTTDGRSYVHASDLFSTQQSVRDLAAIIRALRVRPVDVFGASYGAYFAEYFAWCFPSLVHSLTLDSTYPVDQDFFDAPQRNEIRFALDAVCARSLSCAAAASGSSNERIRRLARRLSREPLKTTSGSFNDGDLDSLLEGASASLPLYELRDLDAAARAWLDHDDAIPLRRLIAWDTVTSKNAESYQEYSEGMNVADTCTMYTTPFDMHASLRERVRQYRRAVAALPSSFFDPMAKSIAENDKDNFSMCLRWPAPTHRNRTIGATAGLPNRLPILMLSGDLDITTPPGDAQRARRWLGKSVRFVSVPNAGHASTFSDQYGCADAIVRAFVAHPQATLDTSCTATLPEVRAVGVFPRTLIDQVPANPQYGDRATPDEERLAAVAVGAIGDAIESARLAVETGERCYLVYFCGRGLRGGHFRTSYGARDTELSNFMYARDSSTSGQVLVTRNTAFPGAGLVIAVIQIRMLDDSVAEQLTITYDERKPRALATIDGYARDGHAIHESVPAP